MFHIQPNVHFVLHLGEYQQDERALLHKNGERLIEEFLVNAFPITFFDGKDWLNS